MRRQSTFETLARMPRPCKPAVAGLDVEALSNQSMTSCPLNRKDLSLLQKQGCFYLKSMGHHLPCPKHKPNKVLVKASKNLKRTGAWRWRRLPDAQTIGGPSLQHARRTPGGPSAQAPCQMKPWQIWWIHSRRTSFYTMCLKLA